MINLIKRLIVKTLGLKNYLRILQRTYFLLYQTGLLKYSSTYEYQYFVKHLINEGDIIIDIGANLGYYSFLFAKWTGGSGRVLSVESNSVYNEIFNEKAINYRNITHYPYILGTEVQMKKPSALFGNLDRIDYIKCDIEGFEYIVLSDMKEVIRKHKPKVQVEVWSNNKEKMLELFDELGYTPYKLHKFQLAPQGENDPPLPGDYIFIYHDN